MTIKFLIFEDRIINYMYEIWNHDLEILQDKYILFVIRFISQQQRSVNQNIYHWVNLLASLSQSPNYFLIYICILGKHILLHHAGTDEIHPCMYVFQFCYDLACFSVNHKLVQCYCFPYDTTPVCLPYQYIRMKYC